MITKYFLVALGFSAIANICMAADTKPAFQWPQKIKAAVSLSYDDAIDSQLDNAIPTLNKYGLKGSFYLKLASPTIQSRLADWRAAAVPFPASTCDACVHAVHSVVAYPAGFAHAQCPASSSQAIVSTIPVDRCPRTVLHCQF